MGLEQIPVFKPFLETEDKRACQDALDNGWLGMGSYVGEFEEEVKRFLEAEDRFACAVSTGHAALHLGLLVAGVGPGDEVITPAFNNIADFQAILATGAEPVFCDIHEDTLCLDLDAVHSLVSERTKAIIATDYACHVCDHDELAAFADRKGLRVIHDAAHSFGSSYRGRKIGSSSDITMFSFDPVKTITCIDGGLLVLRSEEELTRVQEMRLIGMGQAPSIMYENRRAWTYDVRGLGFRYHMANLHAALGLSQLKKIEEITRNRRNYFSRYQSELAEVPHVSIPMKVSEEITPFLYYVRVPGDQRDRFRDHLASLGIDTGVHWQPGHWFSAFKEARRGDLSVTDRVGREIVTLPFHSSMSDRTLERVVNAVSSAPLEAS